MNGFAPKRMAALWGLVLFCLPLLATAQEAGHPFSIYEDASKRKTAEDVLSVYKSGGFAATPAGQANIGFTRSVFWLAFRLDRPLPKDSLVLHIGDHHINVIQVYQASGGRAKLRYTTGDYYPFQQRPLPTTGFYFPVQDTGIYLVRVDKSNESLQLNYGLVSYVKALLDESSRTAVIGFLSGIIFLLLLFGLYLFLLTRDRVYLLYVLYISSGWLWVLSNSGHGFEYLWPDSPWFASKARPVFSFITLGLSLNFMLHYVGLRQVMWLRRLVAVLTVLVWILSIIILLFRGDTTLRAGWYYTQVALPLVVFSYIIMMLVLLGVKSWQGNRLAQFYLVAILSLLVVVILQLLFYTGNWQGEQTFFSQFGVALGYISEAIILTAGLAYRFNEYKLEKESMLLEMNRRQVENTRTLMEVQEAERSQIANQLHDVAGSLLSAAKLNLSSLIEKAHQEQQPLDLRLQKTEEAITVVSETVRNLSHALSPVMLTQVGIKKSLEKIVAIFNASGKIHVSLDVMGFEQYEPELTNYYTGLYSLIYELLNNVVKHAGATQALVQVAELEDCFTVIVEDNGIGIDFNKAESNSLGLAGIHSKINYFGGQIAIDRAVPTGTLITIEIPRNLHAL